jgi:hypothetical protein
VLTDLVDRLAFQRLRSPLARAVVPVVGGALVIGLILLATWGIAVLISHGGVDTTERLAPSTFRVGDLDDVADEIAEDGPLLFPGLNTTTGERTLVLDHQGDDPTRGWRVFWAYPADRDASCPVAQVEGTPTFTDCDGRRLDVSELARPETVRPVVENQKSLSIDLRAPASTTTTP